LISVKKNLRVTLSGRNCEYTLVIGNLYFLAEVTADQGTLPGTQCAVERIKLPARFVLTIRESNVDPLIRMYTPRKD